jgi:competence protein ComEC
MLIIYLTLAWFLGLWLAWATALDGWVWLVGGLAGITFAVAAGDRSRPQLRLGLACLGMMGLGGARYAAELPRIDEQHIAFYNDQPDATVTGRVMAEPEQSGQVTRLILAAESLVLPGGSYRPVSGRLQVITERRPDLAYGQQLQLSGFLAAPLLDPQYNTRTRLAREGIFSQVSFPGELTILSSGRGSWSRQAIIDLKQRLQAIIQRQLPDPHAALLTGILLGDDSQLSPELAEDFRRTGMTHIIAISGFNIALLVSLLWAAGRPFFGPQRAAWLALAGVAFYTVLVGAEASVVRAALMGGLFLLATRLLGRPTFAPAGLFTAGLVMTLVDAHILWHIGFQLSFAATLGLMLYVGRWSRWTEAHLAGFVSPARLHSASRFVADVILATLAAMVFTLPLIAFHFQQLSLVSPLANLLILPAQPGVMTWGGLSTVAGLVWPWAGQALAWVAWLFLSYTTTLVQSFGRLPGAAATIGFSPASLLVSYLVIFGLTWLSFQPAEKRAALDSRLKARFLNGAGLPQRAALSLGVVLCLLLLLWWRSQPDGRLHVTFLNTGRGEGILIQTPTGRQILIDGGENPVRLNHELGRQIPFWRRQLDLLIATHPDEQHLAALPEVIDRYRVGQIITNGQLTTEPGYALLLAAAGERDIPARRGQVGEVIAIDDGVTLELLWPAGALDPADSDSNSLVARLVYGEFRLLLMGDAGLRIEQALLEASRPLLATVLKPGARRIGQGLDAGFLAAVRPQIIITTDSPERTVALAEQAEAAGATLLHIQSLGTMELTTDGRQMWWTAVD